MARKPARHTPLARRLIVVVEGAKTMCLITNLLDHARLSDADATMLYRWRLGIETCFRGLKQPLARRRVRSGNPMRAVFEMHWLPLGYWALGAGRWACRPRRQWRRRAALHYPTGRRSRPRAALSNRRSHQGRVVVACRWQDVDIEDHAIVCMGEHPWRQSGPLKWLADRGVPIDGLVPAELQACCSHAGRTLWRSDAHRLRPALPVVAVAFLLLSMVCLWRA